MAEKPAYIRRIEQVAAERERLETQTPEQMRSVVWKYVLPLEDCASIDMPIGCKVLSAGVQDEQICIWALVDPSDLIGTARYRFRIAGTGRPIKDSEHLDFIDTVLLMGGSLVFHVFQVG